VEAQEWIGAFAEALGVEAPDEATVAVLLEVASLAAHGSERPAAPLACYLLGRAGIDPLEGRAAAQALTAEG
jgi:hypothetical protein